MVKKYSDLYIEARKAFLPEEGEHRAGLLARTLLGKASAKSREQLVADWDKYAGDAVCDAMADYTRRVLAQEPLAYILEEWEFYGLRLYVDHNVLIPRDDTCAVAELAIEQVKKLPGEKRVLDLCTGSGCIGLAVASRVLDARVTLADISPEALAVAKKNAAAHRMNGRVICVSANALREPPAYLGKFDLIVSNPPYITTAEMKGLERSVQEYEPHLALWGGGDGLDFYRSISDKYRACLKPGGYLCFEFGEEQGDAVCDILTKCGFTVLDRVRDFNDVERAVLAQYTREDEQNG